MEDLDRLLGFWFKPFTTKKTISNEIFFNEFSRLDNPLPDFQENQNSFFSL
jgi:hypothetical protein